MGWRSEWLVAGLVWLTTPALRAQYVYSAWAPQFADKLRLTTTETNLIGLAGNLGQYSLGVPIGLFVDNRGSRPAVIAGALLLGVGYSPFRAAYETASGSVPVLCFFAFLYGLGSCMAFAAAVKTSAQNWPDHRGTATAFPLAAFGLSAFVFSLVGTVLFPGDTGSFLTLLAAGTFALTFGGFFFLKVYPPHSSYQSLPADAPGLSDPPPLGRAVSEEAKAPPRRAAGHGRHRSQDAEPGTSLATYTTPATAPAEPAARDATVTPMTIAPGRDQTDVEAALPHRSPGGPPQEPDETSSLMSKKSSSTSSPSPPLAGEMFVQNSVDMDCSHRVDIRGWNLLRSVDFWQLFTIMGILSGIGLMTIKYVSRRSGRSASHTSIVRGTFLSNPSRSNIGHNVNALWRRYDSSVEESFLIWRQQMHVSILSLCSFVGRLLSGKCPVQRPTCSSPPQACKHLETHCIVFLLCLGVGSDYLVKSLRANRAWCLVIACIVFCIAQLCAIGIVNPNLLGFVSSLSGLAYGFLFGVFPSIVAESFGIHGLSQNWGFMTLSPVISGNIFNLFYGAVFDSHSVMGSDGEWSCPDGVDCYRNAYIVTFLAACVGIAVTLSIIRRQHLRRLREEGKGAAED